MSKLIIIGGGYTGLLCGALNPGSLIYEAGPERESDHKAVFRFKSDTIGNMLGIPFKEVTVNKAIWFEGEEVQPTPRFAHMYSQKATGEVTGRSILNIQQVKRFIPPEDFLDRLKKRCKVVYDHIVSEEIIQHNTSPVISTIPLMHLAHLTSTSSINPVRPADYSTIYVNRILLKRCDSHCTVYYPHPEMNTYRASITGDTLITEGIGALGEKELNMICESLGIDFHRGMMNQVHNFEQPFGKITHIGENKRTKFITEMTVKYGIYSLGRFATWRPKVMLDDVLKDIFVIKKLIKTGAYGAMKHKQGENN